MEFYKSLKKQHFSHGKHSLVPIRSEDRFLIMKWRNEQIYHLRQNKPLTEEDQNRYFNNVISGHFIQDHPAQLLFSYLEDDRCIGYGGLVHINWIDKNAEISFIMDTSLEKEFFIFHWCIFLKLLEKLAFNEIDFHKIYTYAFDLRPNLYKALEISEYSFEAELKEHTLFNNKYISVIIHGKINLFSYVTYRKATFNDAELLFNWANDKEVRNNSFNIEPISWNEHIKWLNSRLKDNNSVIYIYEYKRSPIGQIRLEYINGEWVIDYSVDSFSRNKGFGAIFIKKIIILNKYFPLSALVKKQNKSSIEIFNNIGFVNHGEKLIKGHTVIHFKYE